MSLYSCPVMCPNTKGEIVSGGMFVSIHTDTGEVMLTVACIICHERHHFPFKALGVEAKKIAKEDNVHISS